MHWAFVPACLIALADPGYEMMLIPAMLCSNTAQAGATFGAALKTKDKEMKQMAFPAGVSALLAGVTEPAMYGVTLKLKKPMIAACIAGGIGGFRIRTGPAERLCFCNALPDSAGSVHLSGRGK